MKILFFDIETTGLSPADHAIIQLSCIADIDGEVKGVFNESIAPFPGAKISDHALDTNGKTWEEIKGYQAPIEAFRKLTAFLDTYVSKFDSKDKFFLCGYNNAAFDNPFLRRFFERNFSKFFGSYFWSNSLDAMVLATNHLAHSRPLMENFKLATVVKAAGLEVDENRLHDSLYDVELTRALFYSCKGIPHDTHY